MATPRHALRQRREELDLSQEEVALRLGISTTAYRAIEDGTTARPRIGRRTRIAEILKMPVASVNLALDAPMASPNGQSVPPWLKIYAQLEENASHIRAFHPFTVHALLQTAGYAEAVERADAIQRTDDGIARRVEMRLDRQRALDRGPNSLQLAVILDESTLLRVTGGQEVMAEQLAHLVDVAARPNVDLRILPLAAGQHSAAFGNFTLIGEPSSSVCVEDRTGISYLESEHAVDAHRTVFDHLRAHTLTADDSVDLIRTVAKEYQQ